VATDTNAARDASLDWLRAIAILAVIVIHSASHTLHGEPGGVSSTPAWCLLEGLYEVISP